MGSDGYRLVHRRSRICGGSSAAENAELAEGQAQFFMQHQPSVVVTAPTAGTTRLVQTKSRPRGAATAKVIPITPAVFAPHIVAML